MTPARALALLVAVLLVGRDALAQSGGTQRLRYADKPWALFVEIHLSKVEYQPDDDRLFDAALRTVRFRCGRGQPGAQLTRVGHRGQRATAPGSSADNWIAAPARCRC
jgi:hypothetical protein